MKRADLFKEPSINQIKFKQLEKLLKVIVEKIDADQDVSKEISSFHKVAEKNNFYELYSFENYWKSSDEEEFINEILIPEAPKIENITLDEILYIIQKFETGKIIFVSYYIDLLTKNTKYPYVHDIIFWPNTLGYDLHIEAKEVAKIIFLNEVPPTKENT